MADDRDIDRIDRDISGLRTDLRNLDDHGSRGVVGLQVQVSQLIKDVAQVEPAIEALRQEVRNQFALHEQSHQAEEMRRTSRTRWLVGTALTMGGLIGGFLSQLIEHLLKASG